MRGKLVLLVGFGIGYVLGARAGRGRYEQIKRAASRFWNDPRVSHQVHNVEQFARDKAPDVVYFIGGAAKKAVNRTPAKESAKSDTAKSGTAKSGTAKSGTAKSKTAKSGTAKSSGSAKKATGSSASSTTAKK